MPKKKYWKAAVDLSFDTAKQALHTRATAIDERVFMSMSPTVNTREKFLALVTKVTELPVVTLLGDTLDRAITLADKEVERETLARIKTESRRATLASIIAKLGDDVFVQYCHNGTRDLVLTAVAASDDAGLTDITVKLTHAVIKASAQHVTHVDKPQATLSATAVSIPPPPTSHVPFGNALVRPDVRGDAAMRRRQRQAKANRHKKKGQ